MSLEYMKTGPTIDQNQNEKCKKIQVSYSAQEQYKIYGSLDDVNKYKISK